MSKIWMTIKQVERERELATDRDASPGGPNASPWDTIAMYRERVRPVRWSERLGALLRRRIVD